MQNKARLEQQYNRRVKVKTFSLGDLVWRTILLIGSKDSELGKWSPNWERPYEINQVVGKNVYRLRDLTGKIMKRTVNGLFLKDYLASSWDKLPKNTQEQINNAASAPLAAGLNTRYKCQRQAST